MHKFTYKREMQDFTYKKSAKLTYKRKKKKEMTNYKGKETTF